ncbi:hypothetical protein BT63DRAFT_430892 [Microthyrium microscopicum]|uniref:Chloride channel protein n=1 Tax=Microthyrium microscopicum TaxID=703497 RepID=A0A6A6USV6_9PEZI|nr:hypothetical protein BT63DRAFT_430892 [Microthyrium microscopicum]
MSGSSSRAYPSAHAEASSSSSQTSPNRQPIVEDGDSDDEQDLLSADPLHSDISAGLSFKRKTKNPSPFSFPTWLSSSPYLSNRGKSPSTNSASRANTPQPNRQNAASRSTEAILPYLDAPADLGAIPPDTKDGSALDWYVEGPGRRVGYDDLTAIDWIFEYAKERQRQRVLYGNTSGISGYIRQIADASQIWWVLIATGIAAGVIAAFIDVASDWLGDLKQGVCSNIQHEGRFYLNRSFCCWGVDALADCRDWRPWHDVFGITSAAGGWIMEYFVFISFSIALAVAASILVKTYAPYAQHSGIPEIKTVLGGFVIQRFLGGWTLVIKSIGLCLAVASGLWLGKEGPLVHVACCCANLFLKAFTTLNSNEARKREILSAAAAAGISVAFGSPIGGVLFSLEQLSYYFPDKTMWQSFVCAMIAAVTLQAFNPFRTGKLVLYQVTYHSGWHGFEMIPFAILGVLGGLYGGLFIKLNMRIAEWRKTRGYLQNPQVEVTIVALITALINYPIKFMRAQASELVYTLFAECVDIVDDQLDLCLKGRANTGVVTLLIVAAILGFFLAALTFGLQIPAGIILPSMAIGALYGRAVGLIFEIWQAAHPNWLIFRSCEPDIQCITPGTYAIIGAASALGGATRMTVSIVVIMFELTGALTYVLPIMIAVLISKWVGDAISPLGVYESWIQFKGYPFLDNRDEAATAPDVPTNHLMTRIEDLVVITATGHTIQSLNDLLNTQPFRGFPIIDNPRDALLLGYVSRTELNYALQVALSRALPHETEAHFIHQPLADPSVTLDLRPWMDQTPITLNANSNFGLTVSMFQKLGLRYVLFTDKGTLRGLMTKKDIWLVLNGRQAQELGRREDMMANENGSVDNLATGLLGDDEDEEEESGGR